jgi:DNA-binding MarR family transcriptional regulator
MHNAHLVNALGSAGLAITDLISDTVATAAGTSRSGAAALAVLLQAGELTVTELGLRVGLSQPAAARMVDTLERAGYASRLHGSGRSVLVGLTESGNDVARQVLTDRSTRLDALLDGLTDTEQQNLADLIDKVLANVYTAMPDANRICRLCDRAQCVQTAPRCPVGVAAGEGPGWH